MLEIALLLGCIVILLLNRAGREVFASGGVKEKWEKLLYDGVCYGDGEEKGWG